MFSSDNQFQSSAMELKDNTVIVVLGASGDLAKKKTVRRKSYGTSTTSIFC
jgi:hypothetical protein